MRYDSNYDGMTPILIVLALVAFFAAMYAIGYVHGRYAERRKQNRIIVDDTENRMVDGMKVITAVNRE